MTSSRATSRVNDVQLSASIDGATRWLLDDQHADGYWVGELEANVSITAEYLLLTHFTWTCADRERLARRSCNYLKQMQLDPDGGWPHLVRRPQRPQHRRSSAYFAHEAGPARSPTTTRRSSHGARPFDWVLAQRRRRPTRGSSPRCGSSLFGQWEWDRLHGRCCPWRSCMLPALVPAQHLRVRQSWARGTIVAMHDRLHDREAAPASVPAVGRHAGVELLPRRQRRDFDGIHVRHERETCSARSDLLQGIVDRGPAAAGMASFPHGAPSASRTRALKQGRRAGSSRPPGRADGSWGGIQPPWVYSLMALRTAGLPDNDHPVMRQKLAGFNAGSRARSFAAGRPRRAAHTCPHRAVHLAGVGHLPRR